MVRNLPANAGDLRDVVSICGSGRYPGAEHGNPLQYSRLENPMDREAWPATVQGVAKSQTGLSRHLGYLVSPNGIHNSCRFPVFLCILFAPLDWIISTYLCFISLSLLLGQLCIL